jgi:2-desacetyl-2-hydroxyethyl bacteriochlorophyllide A dehydrogenase
MKAARFTAESASFSVENVDEPDVGPNDVLVRIEAAGVCGSDAHYRDPESDFEPEEVPLTMGHEGAGEVVEVGSDVDSLASGDRVLLHYIISCGECRHCRRGQENRCPNRDVLGHDVDGTFGEYVSLPARCALPMSDDVPYEWGAIASCAVATAYHAVQRADLRAGETVTVFGIGGVGQHVVMWADFFGAGKVIAVDLFEEKLDTATEFGADVTIDGREDEVVDTIMEETDGFGSDVSIECSGSSIAMEQCLDSISGSNMFASGRAVSVGLQHEPFEAEYWGLREGSLMVSGDHTGHELQEIIRLMEEGKIDLEKSITHSHPLTDVNEALEQLENNEGDIGRIVLDL